MLTDEERAACERLSRVNGTGELRATLLALLLTPDSQRERRAWREETKGLSTAQALSADIKVLGPSLRLPWFETLLARVAKTPLADRQSLVETARRVMTADGQVRPIDRLHWLAMRHRLSATPPAKATASGVHDVKDLSLHQLRQIALFTAFLARLVPGHDNGAVWYRTALYPWLKDGALPECESPDADALAHALADIQSLPWMLKPVVVRAWLDAALTHSMHGRLADSAADALRLSGLLLDSPLPPELARHYVEPVTA